eukprot:UN0144
MGVTLYLHNSIALPRVRPTHSTTTCRDNTCCNCILPMIAFMGGTYASVASAESCNLQQLGMCQFLSMFRMSAKRPLGRSLVAD